MSWVVMESGGGEGVKSDAQDLDGCDVEQQQWKDPWALNEMRTGGEQGGGGSHRFD